MHRSILLVLALLCASVQAQITCLPITQITPAPLGTGSTTKDVETDAAEASAWWCPEVSSGGVTRWRMNMRWNLKKTKTSYDWRGSFARVKSAPTLLDAVNGEIAAYSVATTAGTQDRYDEDKVKYLACVALTTPPYLVPIQAPSATFCGSDPGAPPVITPSWVTPNVAGLKVYLNNSGKLGAAIPGRTAPAGFACRSDVPKVTLGTSVYYPLTGAPLNELVLCKLVQ